MRENTRLLRVQVIGRDEAALVVGHFDIPIDESAAHTRGTDHDDAFASCCFHRVQCGLRRVSIADTCEDNGHVPWQQVFDPVARMVRDAREYGAQIRLGIGAVELGRTDQTVDCRRTLAT